MVNDRFKFRFLDIEEKTYKSSDYPFFLCDDGDVLDTHFDIRNDDVVVEQCTGLKDKNGKLIYEGDIISRNGMFRKVFWLDDEGGFGYEPGTLFEPLQTKTCEIVGNIHENPELLESEGK